MKTKSVQMSPKNIMAKSLSNKQFTCKVVKNKKTYSRKDKYNNQYNQVKVAA